LVDCGVAPPERVHRWSVGNVEICSDYAWTMDTIVETPVRAASEWTFSYVVTEAVPRSAGRRIRFRGMSLFELEGGRIAAYREHVDTGVALLQLGFAPESLAKVLARRL
jgi:hypothetical protein